MWSVGGVSFKSRLFLGTACYASMAQMESAVKNSGAEVITLSMRRQYLHQTDAHSFWTTIQRLGCHLLPNTAGSRDAKTAIATAELARELFQTSWIKLEVIGDEYSLQPDPFELLQAAKILIQEGYEVFPYCTDDLVLCQRLIDAGCRILMPWASPIGSGLGLLNPYALKNLRLRFPDITLIIDAGIGKPSHAVQVMEIGYDAVLLNTAVARSNSPDQMAVAFRHAVIAGREGYEAGLMIERPMAQPSTPLIDTPFWHQELIT